MLRNFFSFLLRRLIHVCIFYGFVSVRSCVPLGSTFSWIRSWSEDTYIKKMKAWRWLLKMKVQFFLVFKKKYFKYYVIIKITCSINSISQPVNFYMTKETEVKVARSQMLLMKWISNICRSESRCVGGLLIWIILSSETILEKMLWLVVSLDRTFAVLPSLADLLVWFLPRSSGSRNLLLLSGFCWYKAWMMQIFHCEQSPLFCFKWFSNSLNF